MGERVPERGVDTSALVPQDEDRAFAVIALAVSALSGFVMGLLVQGSVLHGLLTLALTASAAALGWWLRGVL